jgi:hypothetical protein
VSESPAKKKTAKKKRPKLKSMLTKVIGTVEDLDDAKIASLEEIARGAGALARSDLNEMVKNRNVTIQEVRDLVDSYYQSQRLRIAIYNRLYAEDRKVDVTMCEFSKYIAQQLDKVESVCGAFIAHWSQRVLDEGKDAATCWALSVPGVGPISAATLKSEIDITKCVCASNLWSFAGFGNKKWEKGQKRPFNARLKQCAWKIAASFVKLQKDPDCWYGHMWAKRKLYELERNEPGGYNAPSAAVSLESGRNKSSVVKSTLKQGLLPPFVVNLRAMRWIAKLFLAHYFEVAFKDAYGKDPPAPYPIQYLGHVHYLEPYGTDMKCARAETNAFLAAAR